MCLAQVISGQNGIAERLDSARVDGDAAHDPSLALLEMRRDHGSGLYGRKVESFEWSSYDFARGFLY